MDSRLTDLYEYGGWTRLVTPGRVIGGEGGIRTPDSLATMSDFESGAFNRALPPLRYGMTCHKDAPERGLVAEADVVRLPWPRANRHGACTSLTAMVWRGNGSPILRRRSETRGLEIGWRENAIVGRGRDFC